MESKKNVWCIRVVAVIVVGAFVMLMWLLTQHTKQTQAGDIAPSEGFVTPEPTYVAHIVIDAGHGGFDHGAAGNKTGVGEDVINLAVSKMTMEILSQKNIKATLTRYDDEALADTKKADMKERRRIMHQTGADLTVSIHMNKFKDTSVHGPMVFYTEGDIKSEELAECVLRNLCNSIEIPTRLTNPGDYYVIRDSDIPAIIVECGFLSNPTEERKLCDADYQWKIAEGIAAGISEFVTNRQ